MPCLNYSGDGGGLMAVGQKPLRIADIARHRPTSPSSVNQVIAGIADTAATGPLVIGSPDSMIRAHPRKSAVRIFGLPMTAMTRDVGDSSRILPSCVPVLRSVSEQFFP